MKFSDILDFLKPVASVAVSTLIPGGGLIVEAINQFLPDDEKLPANATGQQVIDAYDAMPPDLKVKLKELDVDVIRIKEEGFSQRYIAAAQADGQSTRPKIALMLAVAFVFPYIGIGCGILYAIIAKQVELADMWPTLVAYLGLPLGILRSYFGVLRDEQGNRLGVKNESVLNKLFGNLASTK